MITWEHSVALKEGQTLYLIPVGDVHYNVEACDKERFLRLVEWIQRKEKDGDICRIIGMGDYTDFMSTSERAAIIGAKGGMGLHDTSLDALDEFATTIANQFISAVYPIRHTFIGLTEGHHFMKFLSGRTKWDDENGKSKKLFGMTSTEYICMRLGCYYFGTVGYGKILLPHDQRVVIVAHHGGGGSRTIGSKVAQRQRFKENFADADAVLMGHDHVKLAVPIQSFFFNPAAKDGVAVKKCYLIATGSFLKGYEVGQAHGSYIEEKYYNAVDLGVTMLTIRVEKDNKRWRTDIHASV